MIRDRAVADDEDFEESAFERLALGDEIDLLLHRAGIGIDVDRDGFDRVRQIIARGRVPCCKANTPCDSTTRRDRDSRP
jgi:hypothetical protein